MANLRFLKTLRDLVTFVLLAGGIGHVGSASPKTPPELRSQSNLEIECPEEVRSRQQAGDSPKGWQAHIEPLNSRQLFTVLSFTEGPPKEGAVLKPDDETATEPKFTFVRTVGRDIHLVCEYSNTLMRLSQKLPKTIKSCWVGYSPTRGHVQMAHCD